MSIYGPTPLVVEDLEEYAKQTYVDARDNLLVEKAGSTMTGDLHMSGKLVRGLPTVYPPLPPQYTNDSAVCWTQVVQLTQDAINTTPTPTLPQNAANKEYVDAQRHKPIISIATEHTGALTADEFQWSFGNGGSGSNFGNCGYAMPSAGRLLRMSLAVTGTIGGTTAVATIRLVVNGMEITGYTITKLSSEYSGTRTFVTPRELLEGDVVNFRTMIGVSDAAHAVLGALIELDI